MVKIIENGSIKRIALSKANTQMVIVASVAAFVTVFCLVGLNYLINLHTYQSDVITKEVVADRQLKADVSAASNLVTSYRKFVGANPTVISTPLSYQPYVYNNATVVLDALPSQYDFPALVSSVQKFLQADNVNATSIGGSDNSAAAPDQASSNPQPIAIPFTFSVQNVNYANLQQVFKSMQQSIRPLRIDTINLSGTDVSMNLNVNAHTFYQPSKKFNITTEIVAK